LQDVDLLERHKPAFAHQEALEHLAWRQYRGTSAHARKQSPRCRRSCRTTQRATQQHAARIVLRRAGVQAACPSSGEPLVRTTLLAPRPSVFITKMSCSDT
jgi:hypothetical protein